MEIGARNTRENGLFNIRDSPGCGRGMLDNQTSRKYIPGEPPLFSIYMGIVVRTGSGKNLQAPIFFVCQRVIFLNLYKHTK